MLLVSRSGRVRSGVMARLAYMPKGTELSLLTEADFDAIADQLNNRPRKTLNWETPKQRLELLLRA